MKHLRLFLLLLIFAYAKNEPIEVVAENIITDQNKGTSIISGNVTVKQGKDKLNTNELTLYFNTTTRRPTSYHAKGNVHFEITLEDGRVIQGGGNEVFFIVDEEKYELLGNAYVQEAGQPNRVRGNKIAVSRKNGYLNVQGSKNAPAKVIFKLDENPSKKD
ncbi:lipopolysaccharide transport periplasmic protein LptA [Helicobacter monodelphidis]|uniref:lipopolysaccharide transport periplasmic protein LptA n=1 Tax=Helicobacter sp. 15-1451 TaxID=2004995 RepID=UPI000DCDEED6|nr:lipopolysaccharide transport periplasmic protein LptA [Helicobacter sp. 15-1451]RAX58874.1 lipopolysaccharide transport periplasmic protein LptA [Helicobacter sp. 15-1451]